MGIGIGTSENSGGKSKSKKATPTVNGLAQLLKDARAMGQPYSAAALSLKRREELKSLGAILVPPEPESPGPSRGIPDSRRPITTPLGALFDAGGKK